MTTLRPARAQAMRRYPALGFLAVAALLAVALPSALTVPNAGPPTLAEFAPVPGQGTSAGGDVSRLGSGSSGGPGSGLGEGGGPGEIPDPGQPSASLKRCVGNPPRQTEDPLSPPCVAFFEGDNFGATAQGVTGDEIRVVIELGGSANTFTLVDYDDPSQTTGRPVEDTFAAVVRAYARYFNERYQTYGRRVHFYGLVGGAGPEGVRAEMKRLRDELGPFAVVSTRVTDSLLTANAAAEEGMLSVAYPAFDRQAQQRKAPLLLSFAPDIQDEAAIAGGYVCRKLAGRPARHSGNATDRNRTRTFGIAVRDDGKAPERPLLAQLIARDLERRCGLGDVMIQTAGEAEETAAEHGLNIAAFRNAEITTVIAIGTSENHLLWGGAAQDIGYLPEWIIPGSAEMSGADQNNIARQMPPAFWRHAFGLTYERRRAERATQQWYQAFREGCPSCADVDDFRNARLYDELTLLFWGIQAAGPRLTNANVDKGLHAIPARPSTSPDLPAAYFAPGNYSWIKDAIAVWWDGSEREPGTANPGCYRVARNGARARANEWARGDDDLFVANMPCQGPSR